MSEPGTALSTHRASGPPASRGDGAVALPGRIAITGATGFLGRHLRARLAEHELIGVARAGGPGIVAADVRDADALAEAFVGAGAVIHAAGRVDHHPDGARDTWEVHVDGTRAVIEACRRAGVRRLVHVSTSGTVAVADRPVALDESAPRPWPLIQGWPYYRAKLAAEELALAASGPDLDVICVNPSLLLGPGDATGASTDPVRHFLDGNVPFAPAGGVSFVDARDVADAVARALSLGAPGHRYLLTGANWSFSRFYEALARLADRPAPRLRAPRGLATALAWVPGLGVDGLPGSPLTRADLELSARFWYVDDRKARAAFGWWSRDPLDTLSDTILDLRQRGLTVG